MKSLEVEADFLLGFDAIFWDFDGVIKESVDITQIYVTNHHVHNKINKNL